MAREPLLTTQKEAMKNTRQVSGTRGDISTATLPVLEN
jgi:hypothetical protein